ncbi:MAG: carbohydrate ABC transporter permease, partial [Thermomicrobiales bacterium]
MGPARRVVLYAAMVLLSIVFLVPLFWLITTSLKQQADVFAYPPVWIPNPVRWSNYAEAINRAPLVRWLLNTTIVTGFA